MRILLVDDEELSRKSIYNFLKDQLGYDVTDFGDVLEAIKEYRKNPFQIVISDIKMPGMDGIEFLRQIKSMDTGKYTDVILITGFGNMESALSALRAGAFDYLTKPLNIEELKEVIKRSMEHISLLSENKEYKISLSGAVKKEKKKFRKLCQEIHNTYVELAGYGEVGIFSDHLRKIKDQCEILHKERSIPVLIEGDTGSGKEIVARMIHHGNRQNKSPFIPLNCSAIPGTLFESELFGYEEGAFTDSKKSGAMGKFELAHEGTLFLDEISELPLELQTKLLRVIEEKEFFKVGGTQKIKVDIRIICATNRNLIERVEIGEFRKDLFFRLNTANISLLPLKKRGEEIIPLAEMFLKKFNNMKNRDTSSISEDAQKILLDYHWPGNIRELHNIVERIVLLYDDNEITEDHLGCLINTESLFQKDKFNLTPRNFELPENKFDLKELEKEIVKKTLQKFDGNKSKAAEYLCLTRSALRSRL